MGPKGFKGTSQNSVRLITMYVGRGGMSLVGFCAKKRKKKEKDEKEVL